MMTFLRYSKLRTADCNNFATDILSTEADACNRIFSTVVACLSGFCIQDQAQIHCAIVRGGGAATPNLTAHCTHVITSELRGDTCRQAMNRTDIRIMSASWVWQSMLSGRMQVENGFCARSTLECMTRSCSAPMDFHFSYGQQVCPEIFPSCTLSVCGSAFKGKALASRYLFYISTGDEQPLFCLWRAPAPLLQPRYVTQMKKSRYAYVTHMKESCHSYEEFMSHI